MKKIVMLVAAAVVVAGSANAAPAKKATAASKKTAVKATTETKKTEAPAVTPAPAEVAPAAQPTTGASSGGKSTSTVAKAQSEVKKSKFSLGLSDRLRMPINTTNRAEDSNPAGELAIRAGYKVSDSVSVGLGTDATHSFGVTGDTATGGSQSAEWTLYDVFASVAKSDLASLPGGVKAKGSLRLYAPTSEGSQETGMIARVRPNLTVSRTWGKFTAAYIAEPQYYFQQYATYKAAKKDYAETATRSFRLLHYAKADYAVTSKLNAYSLVGLDQGWFNEDSNVVIKRNTQANALIQAETGLEYAINDTFALAAGVTQDDTDMFAQPRGNGEPLYNEDYATYFVEAGVNF